MKKMLVIIAAAGAGFAVYKMTAGKDNPEVDIPAEAKTRLLKIAETESEAAGYMPGEYKLEGYRRILGNSHGWGAILRVLGVDDVWESAGSIAALDDGSSYTDLAWNKPV